MADASDWDARYEGAELLWTASPNQFLVSEVEAMVPGRALDVACGEGRNAVWLAEQGWTVVGVDFSAVGLDKARRLADHRGVAPSVEWVEADVLTWVPDPATFDLVAVVYLHLVREERRAVLRRCVEALKPGATILVVGHHLENLDHGHGGPPIPEILHVPDEVAQDLGGSVEVEKAERVLRPVETEDGSVDAIDSLVRAHRR